MTRRHLHHAIFDRRRFASVALIGLVLWLIPMSVLMSAYGWNHVLTQMSWFFTKAALLTFGGAYAVLPYVYQGAVGHYGWLTPTQMIDGLALGETTPGPLIMVVAFVGFVGAYVNAPFGPGHLFLAGAVAASLVTWFTFLPSFLFILAGGPFVESTHNDLKFTAPLTAITAAVVGAIINLALFFGYHVLWPAGFGGEIRLDLRTDRVRRSGGLVSVQSARDRRNRSLRAGWLVGTACLLKRGIEWTESAHTSWPNGKRPIERSHCSTCGARRCAPLMLRIFRTGSG